MKEQVSRLAKSAVVQCVFRLNLAKRWNTDLGLETERHHIESRADKGWAVKRARPSKKVWCSGLGLCLEMSLVFDFRQGLRCGLSIRHCRRHWIMAAWLVFLHFFLVPLCWYAVSERQMLLFFAEGLVGVDKHLLLAKVDVIPKQKELSTV